MDKQPIPETMIQAVAQFADPQIAHDFFVQIRWPYGPACPRMGCGSMDVAFLANQNRWYCRACKKQSSVKVGTIFEDSPISLSKWLPAIWLIASNRNCISSCELARALKVTQKTAWFMLHRIRTAMADESFEKFGALPVEVDETFIGGKVKAPRNKAGRAVRTGRGPGYGKTTVMGIVERKGRIRAFVVPSNRRFTLSDKIREHVSPGSVVYTDGLASYSRLNQEYVHHVIDHATEYVHGHIHTNNIEGFWSVFKRTIKGTYIAPRPKHLQRYVEEQVSRFNDREMKDGPRFAKVVDAVEGRRLTYKALIGR
jgi:transposase-like protein